MNTTAEKIKAEDKLAVAFEKQRPQLPGNAALQDIRQKAINAFLDRGIPNRKSEEYKYSNPEKLFKADYLILTAARNTTLTADSVKQFEIGGISDNHIVLLNGFYSKQLSSVTKLPKGVIVTDLAGAFLNHPDLIEDHFSKYADVNTDSFIALNTSFASDGLFIYVPDKVVMEHPLHIINIVFVKEAALIQPRNLFIVGKNAEVKIVESFNTHQLNVKTTVNAVTEVNVAENAKVQYYKLQNNCENIYLVNTTQVHQQARSHFDTNTVTLNGEWVRNNLNIVADAENCETHLNGLFITRDNQHVDNHTLVDHQKPNCESIQLYKGILDNKSTGVFNGKIYVRRDAQKINAYQSSKNILLSDDATINTKPQLEIYANDVKCSHGSSTGHLNEDALFYLRSRGLGTESARRMLLYAFAADAINTIRIEPLRVYVDALIEKRLSNPK
ncbi:MAG: Fe-S cluster assembly protein SufD [Bacteroidetes bacterium]|nr:Fe-S cluster assembly protein SufD [Bacteroidota bacterium]